MQNKLNGSADGIETYNILLQNSLISYTYFRDRSTLRFFVGSPLSTAYNLFG